MGSLGCEFRKVTISPGTYYASSLSGFDINRHREASSRCSLERFASGPRSATAVPKQLRLWSEESATSGPRSEYTGANAGEAPQADEPCDAFQVRYPSEGAIDALQRGQTFQRTKVRKPGWTSNRGDAARSDAAADQGPKHRVRRAIEVTQCGQTPQWTEVRNLGRPAIKAMQRSQTG